MRIYSFTATTCDSEGSYSGSVRGFVMADDKNDAELKVEGAYGTTKVVVYGDGENLLLDRKFLTGWTLAEEGK